MHLFGYGCGGGGITQWVCCAAVECFCLSAAHPTAVELLHPPATTHGGAGGGSWRHYEWFTEPLSQQRVQLCTGGETYLLLLPVTLPLEIAEGAVPAQPPGSETL